VGGRPRWLDDLLAEEVHRPIREDSRTVDAPGTYLGWPQSRVFDEVLGGGQADFSEALQHLTVDDRALLYARFNQPRHLEELGEAFTQLFATLANVGSPTVIDLGCGPFTAGLALAVALGPSHRFRYYGVDRAPAMLTLGKRFAEGARARGALHYATTCTLALQLDDVDFGLPRGDLTLVVASYLLASPTIDPRELVVSATNAADRVGPGPVAVLYTNSAKPTPNAKYPAFRDALVAAGFELVVDAVGRFVTTRNPADLRCALFLRRERLAIPLERSRT
jgi:SAM-dependent methyltransferase